ncbi:single-stranded-DNA-specific exonuclease RecJ [bacterium]|nr:single-stranded-DNA-specific exonuclease RecJ [bacterium]
MAALYQWQFLHPHTVTSFDQFRQVILDNRHWQEKDLSLHLKLENLTAADLKISQTALTAAHQRLQRAVDNQQKVLIFGDYDADGNCATAIMWQGLRAFGLDSTPFIPDRLRHGYGMSVVALQEIFTQQKPDLIITVDNGITAWEALEYCQQEGVDVIVTDHHQAESNRTPQVNACVHTTLLSGAGVAWFLIFSLLQQQQSATALSTATSLLDLVALATIVDQVPLIGINRQLVKLGLEELRHSQRVGIQALAIAANLKQESLSTRDIGFGLGPCINAVGRLSGSLDALRLLCTQKPALARQLAQGLCGLNSSRQTLTREQLDLAHAQLDPENLSPLLIVDSQEFHDGIIGLIASKLVDEFHRPSIVFAQGDTLAKGSARSIPGFDITTFIRQFKPMLVSCGGHSQAAGLSCLPEKFANLKAAMLDAATQQIKPEQLIPHLTLECQCDLEVINHPELPTLITALEPFGPGNQPLQVAVCGQVLSVQTLGAEGSHLKITLKQKGEVLACLCWRYQDQLESIPAVSQKITLAGTLETNTFRGRTSMQLIFNDWQASK